MESFITSSSLQTKRLGALLARELHGGEIICLAGDLGAGKTTFTQGLLKELKIKGPYTSPTFAIMKNYQLTTNHLPQKNKIQSSTTLSSVVSNQLLVVHHIDAYRINSKDLLELGFKDFAGKDETITIIEWPEKVKKIIPAKAVWINFKWLDEKNREITFLAN